MQTFLVIAILLYLVGASATAALIGWRIVHLLNQYRADRDQQQADRDEQATLDRYHNRVR